MAGAPSFPDPAQQQLERDRQAELRRQMELSRIQGGRAVTRFGGSGVGAMAPVGAPLIVGGGAR